MDYNALGQALESCKGSKDGTTSITSKILGTDRVNLCYTCVVHYAGEASFRAQTTRESDRAKAMLKDAVKTVAKEYKTYTKKDLTTKVLSESDDIEIIQATAHNPRRVAYYRYHLLISVA
jgi:hypothetical protein